MCIQTAGEGMFWAEGALKLSGLGIAWCAANRFAGKSVNLPTAFGYDLKL